MRPEAGRLNRNWARMRANVVMMRMVGKLGMMPAMNASLMRSLTAMIA